MYSIHSDLSGSARSDGSTNQIQLTQHALDNEIKQGVAHRGGYAILQLFLFGLAGSIINTFYYGEAISDTAPQTMDVIPLPPSLVGGCGMVIETYPLICMGTGRYLSKWPST